MRKFDTDGNEVWTDQFGTSARDEATAVAVDEHDNIYVVGYTMGDLVAPNEGSYDSFVRKYDQAGTAVWTVQFGGETSDTVSAVAVDAEGGVIVAGAGMVVEEPHADAGLRSFVRKYDQAPDGSSAAHAWTYRTDALVGGLAADAAGNIILVGSLWTAEANNEVLVTKLDGDGHELWTELYGSGALADAEEGGRPEVPITRAPLELWEGLRGYEDQGIAVAVDASGSIFVAGHMGAFDTGTGFANFWAFLMALTSEGEEVWAVLFEESYSTSASSVAVGLDGNIVVSGNTTSYHSQRSPAGTEIFVRSVSPSGVLLWEDIFGGSGWDTSAGLAVDALGNVFNAGYIHAGRFRPIDQTDAYLRKYER